MPKIRYNNHCIWTMVDVAQLVRAPGCGPGGRGFESHPPPHLIFVHIPNHFQYWAVAKW